MNDDRNYVETDCNKVVDNVNRICLFRSRKNDIKYKDDFLVNACKNNLIVSNVRLTRIISSFMLYLEAMRKCYPVRFKRAFSKVR